MFLLNRQLYCALFQYCYYLHLIFRNELRHISDTFELILNCVKLICFVIIIIFFHYHLFYFFLRFVILFCLRFEFTSLVECR